MSQSDIRYPIGRFASVERPLTAAEREMKIRAVETLPEAIRSAVEGLGGPRLDAPYREGGWTVRQVVHHLADSHVNGYVRFKLAVTEESPAICTYEEARWAELPDAKGGPVEGSLRILDALHSRWGSFLRSLDEEDFRRTVRHPEAGELGVDSLLELYAWHGAHHVAHVTSLREREGW